MKNYVHARINDEERLLLKELKKVTGENESSLVKKGLRLIYQHEVRTKKTALEVAGEAVGCLASGIRDLSTNKKHLEGYGK